MKNPQRRRLMIPLVLAAGMLAWSAANATTIVMNFDDMPNATNGESVGNFYSGGCGTAYLGGAVDCGGPNYGVVWTGDAIAGGAPNGMYSNTSNEPSGPNVMGPSAGNGHSYMNVAAGFDAGFSFYYTTAYQPGSVTVYSGLNATGAILATLNLAATGRGCDGLTDFSCWSPFGVTFAGTAKSVDFSGASGQIVFDDITLGASHPGKTVPEPAALGMLGLGLLLLGGFAGFRRRSLQN